jgi:protein kinase-like protein
MSSQVTRSEHTLEVGAALAGYRIEELLSAGSGGANVYAATHLESERLLKLPPWPVALKVFSPALTRDPAALREFVQLARLQTSLRHPNVVSIYEVGTSPTPFLSMTLARGPSLEELIAEGRLDDSSTLAIMTCVARALEAARERGLVYRRLRPSGVLVAAGDPERAFLGDFGAGRSSDVEADVASTVHGLAAMLFECLTGEFPEPPLPRLSALRPDLPTGLDPVLAKALSADARQRQDSPGELMKAVERAYAGRKWRRARSARARARPGRRARGARGLFSPAALGLCLLIAGSAALGAVAAGEPGEELRPARATTLGDGAIALRLPADWTRGSTPSIPGLDLREAQAVTPREAAGERALVAGRVGRGGAARLPKELLERLPRSPSRGAVELGVVQAYRYSGLRPRGLGREVNLYLVPTTGAPMAIGCLAPPGSRDFMGQCERVASTLRLRQATPVAIAPAAGYARTLRRLVSRLASARSSHRRSLRRAMTPGSQAAAANSLSVAFDRARRAAARVTPPSNSAEAHAAIERALADAGSAYRTMAGAARASDGGEWDLARRDVVSGEKALQSGLESLHSLE